MKGGRTGVCPKVWGPYGWKLLHYMSFRLDKQNEIEKFYGSLKFLLPCSKCRRNFAEHLTHLPIPTKDYGKWVYNLHNRVNDYLAVISKPPKFGEVKDMYKKELPIDSRVWLFVRCIINTHPGVREITEEYISAFKDFIGIFSKEMHITKLPKNYKSRSALKHWYEQYSPIELKNDKIKMCNKECLDE